MSSNEKNKQVLPKEVKITLEKPFIDKRGIFKRNFCLNEIKKSPILDNWLKMTKICKNMSF